MFSAKSVLICPTVQAFYPEQMTRTCATNVTGHAGEPGDASNYDDPTGPSAHVRMDRVVRPTDLPIAFDSARTVVISDGPPSARTASVIDFRQPLQVTERVGWFHTNRTAFNASTYDGSAGPYRAIAIGWQSPLP
jgi:hypothetical protein